jgi:hypothetical protein
MTSESFVYSDVRTSCTRAQRSHQQSRVRRTGSELRAHGRNTPLRQLGTYDFPNRPVTAREMFAVMAPAGVCLRCRATLPHILHGHLQTPLGRTDRYLRGLKMESSPRGADGCGNERGATRVARLPRSGHSAKMTAMIAISSLRRNFATPASFAVSRLENRRAPRVSPPGQPLALSVVNHAR